MAVGATVIPHPNATVLKRVSGLMVAIRGRELGCKCEALWGQANPSVGQEGKSSVPEGEQ